jgi:lactam utilization protein B
MQGTPVQFDDVRVHDRLQFARIYRGFVGGGETRVHEGTVEKITAQTIVVRGNGAHTMRLTRKGWYDACTRRLEG